MLVQVFEVGRTCWPGAVLVSNESRSTTVMPKGYLRVQYAMYHLQQHQLYALRFVTLSSFTRTRNDGVLSVFQIHIRPLG